MMVLLQRLSKSVEGGADRFATLVESPALCHEPCDDGSDHDPLDDVVEAQVTSSLPLTDPGATRPGRWAGSRAARW